MDKILTAADAALRTLFAQPSAAERSPAACIAEGELTEAQRRLSGALMRVNHVGEVCAQALYNAQAMVTRDMVRSEHRLAAGRAKPAPAAWTRARLNAQGARSSLRNPLWFPGASALGVVAAKISAAARLRSVVKP